MLNKHSKVVLKQLIKTNFQFRDIDSFAAQFPKMTVHQVESTLSYLHENGYIACLFADDTIYRLTAEHKGINYAEIQFKENLKFWLPHIISNSIALLALIVAILAYLKQ